jgi:16S rRNA G966 N2-methylase RsmD
VAERYVSYIPITDVQSAPRNPKGHNTTGIRISINRFGFGELPLLDERTGRLVAGHGRHEQITAMHTAGETPPDGVQLADDGTWLLPVIRGWASRSDDEAEAYLIASNQLTTKGGWETRELVEVLEDLAHAQLLEVTGFDDGDLTRMLEELADDADVDELDGGDVDSVPGMAAEPFSSPGDLWLLGRHRLLCGDATNPDHLDAVRGDLEPGLVYTDPPYGISIVKRSGKIGDDRLIWDKENGDTDFADVELAWTNHAGAARLFRHMWNGMLRASERGGGQRVHPTQKPVALAEWAFDVMDPKNERQVVLDVFGGSGSTLIAAHRTDRTALLIEMEPHYVDVICRRFQEHTGTLPVLEATGEEHDFTQPANP